MQKTSQLQRRQKEATSGSQQCTGNSNGTTLLISRFFFLVFPSLKRRKLKIKPKPVTLKHLNKRSETSYNINGQTFKILSLFCEEYMTFSPRLKY